MRHTDTDTHMRVQSLKTPTASKYQDLQSDSQHPVITERKKEKEREGWDGTEGDGSRRWVREREEKNIKNTEKHLQKERKTQQMGTCPKFLFFSFFFGLTFIILSPAILFLSSLHSEKTNKNIRDTTGWRGVNRREWRRDIDQFQQWLCHRNTTQTDKVILKVMTHTHTPIYVFAAVEIQSGW